MVIKKFVDKDAEFVFVPGGERCMAEAKRLGAIPTTSGRRVGQHGKGLLVEALLKK